MNMATATGLRAHAERAAISAWGRLEMARIGLHLFRMHAGHGIQTGLNLLRVHLGA